MMTEEMAALKKEIEQRRTFAIISHPDAGKTTLTEKLLLFGGAIREAGSIKGRKASRHATSDWMEIERKRGISVTSTVLQFKYEGYHVNLLDTPGHQDFSDDTYRTLVAADSAVMLIDAAKGVEPQTIKLFEVCRMRGIPIFTFINKLDRESRDPFELLKELEDVLGIRSYPMNWPVGSGAHFRGIFDRHHTDFEQYDGRDHQVERTPLSGVGDDSLRERIGEEQHQKLIEEITLLDVAGDAFDVSAIKEGQLTPVFFGSAISNFGVETFLRQFLELAPTPVARPTNEGPLLPESPTFAGFVFKIQANMNPAHRDRVAFVRVCAGRFLRGMNVAHPRTGKRINLSAPQQFFAQDRSIVEEAYPGDIIGIFDPGIFRIGDTLMESGSLVFEGLPQFSPEHFARVTLMDTGKYKQYNKGLAQLTEEGTVQLFRVANRTEDLILGVVGVLQFEVLEYRLKAEYGVTVSLTRLPYQLARWIVSDRTDELLFDRSSCLLVKDQDERLVMLFPNEFATRWVVERNEGLTLHSTSNALV